jgi:hypothetical protein
MRLKILGFVLVCLLLCVGSGSISSSAKAAITQETSEIDEVRSKQIESMKDITVIATSIADYVTDNGITPKQDGIYDEKSEFYQVLSPFYVYVLPITDSWGNQFRVYCGEACNGHYGISNAASDDFVAVSYGRDGKKEDWKFDAYNPGAGLFVTKAVEDADKDLVMWNGSWIRGVRSRRGR